MRLVFFCICYDVRMHCKSIAGKKGILTMTRVSPPKRGEETKKSKMSDVNNRAHRTESADNLRDQIGTTMMSLPVSRRS